MANIEYVQNVLAYSASEGASIKTERGSEGIKNGETKRKELEEKIRQKQAEIARLSDELKDASDQNGFERFANWLFGGDGGVGDLQADIEAASAEMKKAQENLKLEQAKLEMELAALQEAYAELGDRAAQGQQNRDENDQGVAAALG